MANDGAEPSWMTWAREILATAQTGLTYAENPYDKERYESLRRLGVRMMAEGTGADAGRILAVFSAQSGYATPKVDVRAAVFQDDRILLVPELADGGRWTLPGGWADINSSPAENIVREVREEAGYEVTVRKLVSVFDKRCHAHPPAPIHAYKLFFLCDIVRAVEKSDLETGAVRFFGEDEIPELSLDRIVPAQIRRMFEHWRKPDLPTDYD